MNELKGPLKGIRILDLTRLLPGPLATQYLADLGAEVIKIEDADHPDYVRFFPPQIKDQSIHYLTLNRSKKSLSFKLGSEEGKAIFYDLVAQSDIVIEGFRPGWTDNMGFDFKTLKQINPAIIYVSLTGYGQTGPLSKKAGHDLNYIGYSGVLALGGKDKKIIMPGVQIADIMGGSYNTVIACLSAVIARYQTKTGQFIDVSMTDGAMQMTSLPLGEFLNASTKYQAGNFMLSGGLANYYVYECKDGKYIALGALEPKFWMGFCQMINRPEWINRAIPTMENVKALKQDLGELFLSRTREEWTTLGEQFDVCLSPVLEMDEIEHHPNTVARQMIVEHEHPAYGKVKGVYQPLKFSDSKLHKGWAAPLLGEHSQDVLISLGYTEEKIRSLIDNGILKV
ncbi:MAG: CaiB/BaiF CoA-transferase family protein [Chitinophagales bacterium]